MNSTRQTIRAGDIVWTWCSIHGTRADHIWTGHKLVCLSCHKEQDPREKETEEAEKEAAVTGEFFYSVWSLNNHEREIASNRYGNRICFYLDGAWKVYSPETGLLLELIDSAVDLCAWLNNREYKPTGEKVQE